MKIRRFLAANISSAMAQVRAELGADAVILSNQSRDGQVEIVCAVDYDETRLDAAVADDLATPRSAQTAANYGADRFDSVLAQSRAEGKTLYSDQPGNPPADIEASTPPAMRPIDDARSAAQQPSVRPAIGATNPLIEEMHHSVESLRDLIEHQILDMVWAGAASHQANTSLAVRKLLEAGFSAATSRTLLANIPPAYSRERTLSLALTLLRQKLPKADNSLLEQGGRVAIIGPSGAGKTTLAVGLAAQYARRHGVSQVALVGMDNQRVGAQEHLRMVGQMLGMQVHIVQHPQALQSTLQALQHLSLVVIDTAGFAGDDPALQPQLRQLMGLAAQDLQTLLVLPAYASAAFLQATVRRYRISIPQRCALTHLDAVSQPGIALSCLLENQLQAELVNSGPRIAEDLQPFDSGQLLARFKSDELRDAQPGQPQTGTVASQSTPHQQSKSTGQIAPPQQPTQQKEANHAG